ncbi:hypothetical protein fh0823_21950 [Francisella halioticida]|uniref:hypothetical protein n=1 Tax=Francisella halioticida TaxID=549298 RepID=UPI0012FC5B28|nr:hypothetical protein [Francisella halioticida]BCD92056.1 hypothetical protein fh0823_21950 [Francisella halioticida]
MKSILIISVMLVLSFTYATATQRIMSMNNVTFTFKQNMKTSCLKKRIMEDRVSSINI